MRRIKTLARQNEALKAELNRARDAHQQAQEHIALLKQRVRAMEEELRAVESQRLSELLMQAAGTGPEGRRLYELAQEYEADNAGEAAREKLRARLPSTTRDGRRMEYEERFLRDMQELAEREKEKVVEALARFAEHGESSPSLKSKRWQGQAVTGAPEGSFESRSSGEYRFFWKQGNNGVIAFYRAGHHTAFSSSEW